MRRGVCVILVFFLLILGLRTEVAALETSSPAQTKTTEKPTIKEQALKIGVGTATEVRLKKKKKLQGRMGTISSEAFVLQVAEGNRITDRTISFDEVQSLKKAGWSTTKKTAVIVVVVFGILLGVGLIVGAATGSLSN